MGKITSPFYDIGIIRCMVFYPKDGVMRRKMVVTENKNIAVNPNLLTAAVYASGGYDPFTEQTTKVFHFEVKSSPEGAILSGRWVPLETIGEYSMSITPETVAFDRIIDSIKKGGMPIRESPKWNQFWSSTADAWIYSAPGLIYTGDDGNATTVEQVNPFTDLWASASTTEMPDSSRTNKKLFGTLGKMENELGEAMDILTAPNPDYGDLDDDLGFVEG